MSVEIVIRCNGCDIAGDSSTSAPAHVIRTRLKASGWRQAGAIDCCPKCWRAEQAEKKARRRS